MTTVAVLAEPPESTDALSDLVANGPLSESEATRLYEAMLRDVCVVVERSGGDLLVNYRAEGDEAAAENAVRSSLEGALPDPESARFEVQVGSSRSARVGNTVTHLLEREGVNTAAVIDPTAAMIERRHVDSAAMKLRQSEVVLGPATDGRVYYAAFGEPIDFADAFRAPSVETLTDRAVDAGGSVDFLEPLPVLERASDLRTVLPLLNARERAEQFVPQRTAAVLADLEINVAFDDPVGSD